MHVDGNKLGMVLGGLAGFIHFLWAFFVAVGWALPIMNFAHGLHFISAPVTILDFNIVTATCLVVVASLIGYGVGRVAALIWNRVYR